MTRSCEQSFLSQCVTPRTSVWEANGAFQKLELAGHTGHFENEILVFKDCNFQIPNLFEILFLPFLYNLKSSLKLM